MSSPRHLCKQLRCAVTGTGGLRLSRKVSPRRLRPTLTRVASLQMRLRKAGPNRGNHAATPAKTNSGSHILRHCFPSGPVTFVCSEGERKPQVHSPAATECSGKAGLRQTGTRKKKKKKVDSVSRYCDLLEIIFGLHPRSWHRAPQTLGISSAMSEMKVSFVTPNHSLMKCWKALRMGAGCQGHQACDRRAGAHSPASPPPGRGEGLEVKSITNGQ